MATDSKIFDDSTATSAPPLYDTISASPIQCDQSSIFSFRRMKQKRAAVLSRIRDIVLAPNFTPSSVTPNINACAAALSAAELSKILIQLNIEGHTALYWAIVNNRPQAFWALFNTLIVMKYPSLDLYWDLRIACMVANDHTLYRQLKLDMYDGGRHMRRILGCPEDKIEVYVCDTPTNRFNVVLQIRMFQKRLRAADGNQLSYEFVLGGRIWWFRFGIDEDGRCSTAIGLQQYSHPARPDAVLSIEVHNWTQAYGVTPCEALKIPLSLTGTQILVPWL
ncbi:hypothetical protein BDR04DRAFT_1103387 [Suillus decipiens]|nr:hypothetical protein BDR04DRAFT_1103387 [Suillus decipiens]